MDNLEAQVDIWRDQAAAQDYVVANSFNVDSPIAITSVPPQMTGDDHHGGVDVACDSIPRQ